MASVTLKAVDRHNWEECIGLSVTDEQKAFIASNLYSLAQAKVQEECVPLAVYEGASMVGFLMYARDTTDQQYWVYRLMIDRRRQGRGLARAAMLAVMKELSERPDFQKLRLSFEPENQTARGLYEALGFRATGEVIDGETVMEWMPTCGAASCSAPRS